jgi:ribonuclease R
VLGAIEDPAIDESLVLAQFGILEREEDDQVAHRRQEAENIWEALVSTPLLPWTGHPQEGFRGRYDFSAFPTLTIDGEDARDFDDGLHWRPLESGCEVGIHIADVSSFVQPGSFWDRDAAQRGNSTYLPLRAIPMLDRVLSEQLCSLMPRSPRFTLSVIVRFDASDELQEAFLVPGRIVSGRRWQYAEADALLAGEEGPADAEEQQKGLVWALDRLSQSLRRQWRARGALEIDLPEPLLQWENQTDIASVQLRAQTPARRLIETLMVLANEQVAQWGDRFQLRMPFRGHQPPEEGHLTSLVELAKGMGVFPDRQGASATIQDLLFRIHRAGHLTQAQQRALMTLAVRHLALAQYVPTNQGHFGLGLSHYTHFTSPIRRYADLLVHRALHGLLVEIGPLSLKSEAPKGKSALTDELPFQWLSFQERMSDRAERSFLLRKVCHRLKRHLGDRFAVTVIAIQEDFLTVYVDDWHVEGRVPADTMGFTHYVCTPTSWVGPGGQTLVKLGDPLQLLLLRVHLPSLRLLFGQQTGSSLEARGKQGKRIVHPKRPQRFPRKRGRR